MFENIEKKEKKKRQDRGKLTQFYIDDELLEALLEFKEKNNLRSMTSTIKSALNDYFFAKDPSNIKEYNYRTVYVNRDFYKIFKLPTKGTGNKVMDLLSNCIEDFYDKYITRANDESENIVKDLTNSKISKNEKLTIAIKIKDEQMIEEILSKYEIDLHKLINAVILARISMNL